MKHTELTLDPSLHPIKEHAEAGRILLLVSQISTGG